MDEENKTFKLNDSVISHVAKVLQIALITGTDIVDNLRMMELMVHDGKLVLTPACEEIFSNNLNSMLNELPPEESPFSS